jgi:hypothetical protein
LQRQIYTIRIKQLPDRLCVIGHESLTRKDAIQTHHQSTQACALRVAPSSFGKAAALEAAHTPFSYFFPTEHFNNLKETRPK